MILKLLCLIGVIVSIFIIGLYFLTPRFGRKSKYDLITLLICVSILIMCSYFLIN